MSEEIAKIIEPKGMMAQYHQIKTSYPDCVLFFRLGDFYEMFDQDAVEVSRLLDLTLTQRAGQPMCGVPAHAADSYLAKLISMGKKVAICEQFEQKPGAKGMMQRYVTKVVTPGTVTDDAMLESAKNNFIMCVYLNTDKMGVAYSDITTGLFEVEYLSGKLEDALTDILTRVSPSEVLVNEDAKMLYQALPMQNLGILPQAQSYYDWAFRFDRADTNLKKQFGENYAKIYEIEDKKETAISAGALLEYLAETQKRQIGSIKKILLVKNADYMHLDATARRNLELVETIRERKRYGSLIWLLDKTKTSMGARKFRYIFDHPLQSAKLINARLDKVEELYKKPVLRDQLTETLAKIGDIERLAGKISYGNVSPKELISLKNSLRHLPQLKQILKSAENLQDQAEKVEGFENLYALLSNAIYEDAPYLTKDGGYIKDGFNAELDKLRNIKSEAKAWVEKLEEEERTRTGIKSLRIIYTRVYGYCIEVNKKDTDRVPLIYKRKQTVANNERYITEDLKLLENQIVGAEEKAIKLEAVIFEQLKEHLQTLVPELLSTADAISDIDAINSFAVSAAVYNYTRPKIVEKSKKILIEGGRHPVVEAFLKNGGFIANDTLLNSGDDQIMIITGPNMAGKSTYMRQVALITFMAHIGSFVPATKAEIAITDRIFTRVGASDDLAFGQSTFMVEMSEVATILANATENSLIILDEIGRGTSTFDGLAIAWSVVEHLSKVLPAKTLFATHYHELTELEGNLQGVKNYKILVKETDDDVIFLRKIVRGGANKSFGIEVARMAGVPKDVLQRAKQISKGLEKLNTKLDIDVLENSVKEKDQSKVKDEVFRIVKDIDPNRLSPMHAFEILVELSEKVKEES